MSITPFNPFGLTTGFVANVAAPTAVQVSPALPGALGTSTVRVVNTGTTVVYMGYGATAAAATAGAITPSTVSVTGSISGNVLTVSAVGSGVLFPSQLLSATGILPNTVLTQQLSGTAGGVGQYLVSVSQTLASTTITSAGSPTLVIMPGVIEVFTMPVGTFYTGTSSASATVYLIAGDGV